jgi:tetratricopeptide (TPR) repeat protein
MDTLLLLTHLYVEGFIEVESAQAPLAEAEAFLHALGPDKLPPHEYQKRLPGIVLLKARMARLQEQWQAAKMYGQEHIRLCEENHWLAHFLSHQTVGQACLELEEYGLARLHFLEALRLANESEDLWQMAVIRRTLGHAAWRQGNSEQAYEYVLDALQLSEKLPDHNLIAMCLEVQVGILVKQGRLSVAVKLSGASHTLYHKQGRKPKEELSLDVLLPGWRDGPESAALTQAFEAGQAMSVEEAMAFALEVATDDDASLRRM